MITITPQARAIAALTLSVLLVFGHLNKLWFGVALVLGDSYPSGRGGQFLTSLALVGIAVAVAAFALAASRACAAGGAWDADVSGAAVAVAVVGVLIAIVIGIGSVANGSATIPGNVLGGGFYY